jgi:hypothetical protein
MGLVSTDAVKTIKMDIAMAERNVALVRREAGDVSDLVAAVSLGDSALRVKTAWGTMERTCAAQVGKPLLTEAASIIAAKIIPRVLAKENNIAVKGNAAIPIKTTLMEAANINAEAKIQVTVIKAKAVLMQVPFTSAVRKEVFGLMANVSCLAKREDLIVLPEQTGAIENA